MTSAGDHRFWADDITGVLRPDDAARAISHRDVTDLHLLAVAARHGGRLATFDTRIARLLDDAESHLVLTLEA
jgi:predicted nucleic acid-binding protein